MPNENDFVLPNATIEADGTITEGIQPIDSILPNAAEPSVLPPVESRDTTPPTHDVEEEESEPVLIGELTPEERATERLTRIAQATARVMPTVLAKKIGVDARQPWLQNPHTEAIVKATIEALYDLNVGQ